MFWSKKHEFIEREREALHSLSEADIESALLIIATDPVRTFLISIIDETVRQGMYLDRVEQEGAKLMVRILGEQLQRGDELLNRNLRKKSQA